MPSSTGRLPPVLWALLFGNFVIGSGVIVVAATLQEIASSLRTDITSAGQLISAAALMICLGAPVFATVVAGWDRRRLLALSLLWFGVFHGICTLADSLGALMPLRVLALIPPAIFTPQAAACVGLLVPTEQRGRAITFIFVGWSLASVVGMPMASVIAGLAGWRGAFVAVAIMSLVGAAWVWRAMPDGVRPPALSRAAWRETVRSPMLMTVLAVTVSYSAGHFVLLSYFAPYWHERIGADANQLALLFLAFGAFGFLGNVLMSRHIDRLGPDRAVMLALGGILVTQLIWPWGASMATAILVCIPWAMGCFASNSAQQARLVAMAPGLASASIALNTSAIYAGQAMGAASGGWVIRSSGFGSLHWVGVAGLVLAMALSLRATHLARKTQA